MVPRHLRVLVRTAISAGLSTLMAIDYAASEVSIPARQTVNGDPVGDPIKGKLLSEVERCQGCHGEDGNSSVPMIPKLSGQRAEYIVKQIRDFKSGTRKHEVMTVMAADIADDDVIDIAAYFASIPSMQGDKQGDDQSAKSLFVNGDAARNIVPCTNCHGVDGKGLSVNGVAYPAIGGQHRKYLRGQMVKWALGERQNEAMSAIAKALTGREIELLSAYISELQ